MQVFFAGRGGGEQGGLGGNGNDKTFFDFFYVRRVTVSGILFQTLELLSCVVPHSSVVYLPMI